MSKKMDQEGRMNLPVNPTTSSNMLLKSIILPMVVSAEELWMNLMGPPGSYINDCGLHQYHYIWRENVFLKQI